MGQSGSGEVRRGRMIGSRETLFPGLGMAVAALALLASPPSTGAEASKTDATAAPVAGAPQAPNCKSYQTTIQQSPRGGYWADGFINNTKVSLHIDTGASVVAVPLSVARAAGLAVGEMGHASTASAVVTTYRSVIPSLRIGNLTFRNVKAAINPHAPDDEVLFGMSALESVSLHQEQGMMVLATEVCGQETSPVEGAATVVPEPAMVLKRSVRECMGPNHVIDKKAMECMKAAR